MNIVEFVGIIILECPRCKQRYVVDTVALQCGFEHRCTCGLVEKTLYKAKYVLQPTFGVRDCMFDPKDKSDVAIKKAYESSLKQSQAVAVAGKSWTATGQE